VHPRIGRCGRQLAQGLKRGLQPPLAGCLHRGGSR